MNHRTQQPSHRTSQEEIHQYLQDLATMPVHSLKAEQEVVRQIALAPDSAEADAARTLLIEANLRLVVRLARRYQPFGEELADLIQEGNLALIKAAQQFDPRRSSHFPPFATQRVNWALYRVVEKRLHERHLPESDREPIHPLRAQVLKALAHHDIDEQALTFDLPAERFVPLTTQFEEANTDDCLTDDLSSGSVSSDSETDPEEASLIQEQRREIAASLQTLPRKERLVLTHRYFQGGTQPMEAVGRELGITRQSIYELEQQGLRKLRYPRISRLLRGLL